MHWAKKELGHLLSACLLWSSSKLLLLKWKMLKWTPSFSFTQTFRRRFPLTTKHLKYTSPNPTRQWKISTFHYLPKICPQPLISTYIPTHPQKMTTNLRSSKICYHTLSLILFQLSTHQCTPKMYTCIPPRTPSHPKYTSSHPQSPMWNDHPPCLAQNKHSWT